MPPAVAIVMRTKDRAVLLARAFESVLGQTHADWVLVVVNDGGDPAPVDALAARHRDRFRGRLVVLHNPQSVGMEAASNRGLRAADSRLVVIHDDDDSWEPGFLETAVAVLDAAPANIAGVVTHSVRVTERIVGERVVIDREEPYNDWVQGITLYRMAGGNLFPPISFLYRRAVLDAIGCYREDLPVLGDWEFNLRFLARYDMAVVPRPLARYHQRPRGDAAYANSIYGAQDKHALYDSLLRNELLRRDLATGRVGVGTLVNLAHHVILLELKLNALMEGARRVRHMLDLALRPVRWVQRAWRRLGGR